MRDSYDFLKLVLDTVKHNIAVLDADFNILFTNQSWQKFGLSNGCQPDLDWNGINYLKPIKASADAGDQYALMALKGFKSMQTQKIAEFNFEYPCHSAIENRWFSMQLNNFEDQGKQYFVVSHQDITQRVQLELESKRLARVDAVTEIANRLAFDEFLENEWRRCKRSASPLSVAIIDLDDFKYINDNFGHQMGDICLRKLADILTKYASRASDLCARFGGDEFVIVWGSVSYEQALKIAKSMHDEIKQTSLKCDTNEELINLSASIGIHTIDPTISSPIELMSTADEMMYKAKSEGKNRVCVSH